MKKAVSLRFITMTSLLSLFSSCATEYKKMGKYGGYEDKKLDVGLYEVTYQGNTKISDEKIHHYFLRRSAEVTKENQFQYFKILDSKETTQFTTVPSEGAPATKARVTVYSYSGGQTFKPSENKTLPKFTIIGKIKLYKEGEQPMNVYNADEVLLKSHR